MLCLATVTVEAATYTVNDPSDGPLNDGMCDGSGTCTLRAAIQAANATPNIADTINLPAGTYFLTLSGTDEDAAATGDLDITDELTITGAGSDSTIIDGKSNDRVFHVMSGVKVTISGVTIQHGVVHGGIGGGIYNQGGTLTVDNSILTLNEVDNSGVNLTGGNGGGVYNSGTMTITASDINSNVANTTIAGGGGGGLYNTGKITIDNCTLNANQATGNDAAGGGAIQNEGTTGVGSNDVHVIIKGSTLSNNTAPLGAAVRNLFGRIDMEASVVENNSAGFSGGGIENVGGNTEINTSAIRNNDAPQSGGGIDNLAAIDISTSTISGNTSLGLNPGAGGSGGGIFNSGEGNLTLVNSTVSANQARQGGGLYNHKDASITNSTIYDNTATSSGAEVYACGNKDDNLGLGCNNQITDSLGNLLIKTEFVNTIIGGSGGTGRINCDGDVADLITSKGHNIETANSCGFAASGDIINVSPADLFSTGLQYNEGDYVWLKTFAIPETSPARNAGDFAMCPLIDERGYERNDTNDNQCDIGAYEISTVNSNFAVLDLALDIQYKNATPLSGTVQTTISLTVVNKGSLDASNVVLTGSLPVLSWLKLTNVGGDSGSCTTNSTGFVCTVGSIAGYQTVDFFAVTIASAAGSYTLDGEVKSDQADNYRPDNLKSITVTIPTVSGSSVGGNNFGGSGGGGAIGWLTLTTLLAPTLRRTRRR